MTSGARSCSFGSDGTLGMVRRLDFLESPGSMLDGRLSAVLVSAILSYSLPLYAATIITIIMRFWFPASHRVARRDRAVFARMRVSMASKNCTQRGKQLKRKNLSYQVSAIIITGYIIIFIYSMASVVKIDEEYKKL